MKSLQTDGQTDGRTDRRRTTGDQKKDENLNALRTQTMASVNSTVHQIHILLPQAHVPPPTTFIGSSRSSKRKRGMFDFIGQISKSLFGTADEIAILQRHMPTLNNNNVKIAKAMAVQEKHLSSFISAVDECFNNIMDAVQKNHQDTMALNDLLFSSMDGMEHEFVLLEQLILKQTNASSQLDIALEHIKLSIHELVKGKLSPFLINPHALKSALNQIHTIIDKKFPQFNIIHKDPLYYFTFGDFLYTRVHSTLYLTLKVPISPFKQPLLLISSASQFLNLSCYSTNEHSKILCTHSR